VTKGKLYLVDLAGSETVSKTGVTGLQVGWTMRGEEAQR